MPPFWVKLPLTVSVPIELPGRHDAAVGARPPMVPLPPSMPPLFTVTRLASCRSPQGPPAFTVVPPVKVLAPVSVSVPVPILTSDPPVPPFLPPSAMTPLTVVERLLAPTVSCLLPRRTQPAPSIEPAVVPEMASGDIRRRRRR